MFVDIIMPLSAEIGNWRKWRGRKKEEQNPQILLLYVRWDSLIVEFRFIIGILMKDH